MSSASSKKNNNSRLSILARVTTSIVGGYVLANLVAILLSYWLPMPEAEGVMTGILLSYLVYACVVMWVFSVKSTQRACLGVLVPCLVLSLVVFLLIPGGLF